MQYIYDKSISCINKVKIVETLCKITTRFGELLPYYVDKYSILDVLCHLCSSRSKLEDYCSSDGVERQQLVHDWNILRTSCLSNINDIILTLGIYSNKYILKIIDIALGILQHEQNKILVLKRGSLYLLNTIMFLYKTCGGYSATMNNKEILMEKLRCVKIVLENLLVNGNVDNSYDKCDSVCKHHIQNCLELFL